VDFLRRTLTAARQVQRANGGQLEIRPPKYGSERTVYLADGLVTILSAHVAAHCPGDDPGRWLFGGELPPHQNTVGHWWRKARTAAGCPAVKLHDLRHYYASGLIAAGCDVVTVQRALGHASATVTLNTYAHLWPTAEDRTRAAAARCWPRRWVLRTLCGLAGKRNAVTCQNSPHHTLKRKSTTSPSCIT
jgi:integrase